MKNIIKKDTVDHIAVKTGLTQIDVKTTTESLLESIKESLSKDRNIEIRGFRRFKQKHKKARVARNPRTGEKVNVEAKFCPKFEASRELIRRMNNIFIQKTG